MNVVLFGELTSSCLQTLMKVLDYEKVYGASFCSDSKGTIHAVFEVHLNNGDSEFHGSHRLWYQRCEKNYGEVSTNLFMIGIGRGIHQHLWMMEICMSVGSLFDLRTFNCVHSRSRIQWLFLKSMWIWPMMVQHKIHLDEVSQILYTSKARRW